MDDIVMCSKPYKCAKGMMECITVHEWVIRRGGYELAYVCAASCWQLYLSHEPRQRVYPFTVQHLSLAATTCDMNDDTMIAHK